MTIRRITISVPEDIAKRIKKAAGNRPVSTWVTDLVEEHLDDATLERQWEQLYEEVSPKPAEVRRADAMFKRLTGRSRKKGAA